MKKIVLRNGYEFCGRLISGSVESGLVKVVTEFFVGRNIPVWFSAERELSDGELVVGIYGSAIKTMN